MYNLCVGIIAYLFCISLSVLSSKQVDAPEELTALEVAKAKLVMRLTHVSITLTRSSACKMANINKS